MLKDLCYAYGLWIVNKKERKREQTTNEKFYKKTVILIIKTKMSCGGLNEYSKFKCGNRASCVGVNRGCILSFWRTRVRSCFNNSRDSSKFNMGCKV